MALVFVVGNRSGRPGKCSEESTHRSQYRSLILSSEAAEKTIITTLLHMLLSRLD
jgi:hypothetical protein